MKSRLLTFGVALAVLAVMGRFYAEPVIAQVRAALVQNVDEPGRNPFAVSSSSGSFGIFTVPAGKRYVIEGFTASCNVDSVGFLSVVGLQAMTGGVLVRIEIPANFQDTNGNAFGHPVSLWFATGSTHVYADPGTTFFVTTQSDFNQTGAAIRGDCNTSAWGYSVSNP